MKGIQIKVSDNYTVLVDLLPGRGCVTVVTTATMRLVGVQTRSRQATRPSPLTQWTLLPTQVSYTVTIPGGVIQHRVTCCMVQ